jgi:predicted nucleotidyltransferase
MTMNDSAQFDNLEHVTKTEARKSWDRLINRVVDTNTPVIPTRYGKSVAILAPYDLDRASETVHGPAYPELSPSERLTPEVVRRAVEVFTRPSATNIRLVGSVARGTDEPGSDVDFLAHLAETFSMFDLAGLVDELESVIGCRVDVISDGPRGGAILERLRAEVQCSPARGGLALVCADDRHAPLLV